MRRLLRALLASAAFMVAASGAQAQLATITATVDQTCAATRNGTNLGCTANDVTAALVFAQSGGTQLTECVAGTDITLNLTATLNSGSTDRYDLAFFFGQTGNAPNTLGGSCSIGVFPFAPNPPFYNETPTSTTNMCGDFKKNTTGATLQVNGIKLRCSAAAGTNSLAVPYVLSWDQNTSVGSTCNVGTVFPGTGSKCSSGTASTNPAVVVKGYVKLTKATTPSATGTAFGFTASSTSQTPAWYLSDGTTLTTDQTLTDGQTKIVKVTLDSAGGTNTLTIQETENFQWGPDATISCVAASGATANPATVNNATRTITAALTNANFGAECTITNQKRARITMAKTVGGRISASDQFTLTTSGGGTTLANDAGTGTVTSPVTVTTSGSTTGVASTVSTTFRSQQGQSLTITDSMAAGSTYAIGDYIATYSCTNATAGSGTTMPSGTGTSLTLTPAANDDITCTFNNTPKVILTKAFGASSIGVGTTTSLTFTITNTASDAVARSGIQFTDTFPAGLVLANPTAPSSSGCGTPTMTTTDGSTSFTASSISVAAGGTCTITTTVRGSTTGSKVNGSAQIGSTLGLANAVTNQTLNVVAAASVAKTFGAASINDNAATTLVFTLTNGSGNPAQSGISLGDTLPSGLRFTSTTPSVAYSSGCSGPATAAYDTGTRVLSGLTGIAMTSGTASCTVTVSGLTNAATQTNSSCAGSPAAFTNLSTSVSVSGASNTSTNQCLVVNVVSPSVAKTFGAASINDNAATTMVFTLTNSGSNPAQSGIAVGDTLPTGLRFNSTTPSVSYSSGCSGPATAAYDTGTRVLSGLTGIAMTSTTASCTVTVAGLTNATAQTNASCTGNPAAFTNLSTSVTTTNATNTSTDQCLVVSPVAPSVAKTFGAASINDNATTTLVFTLTNSGSNPAQSGIALGDTLPTGLRFNSTTPSVSYSTGCSGPASAAYDTSTRVLSGLTGIAMTSTTASCTVTVAGLTNTATQTNSSCSGNPAAFTNASTSITTTNATNTSTDQCLVVNTVAPSVAKTFGAASINDNATTTLVFTLTNSGSNPAQSGIALGDTLPTGLRFNSTTPAVTYSAGCSGPATAAYNTSTRVLSGLTGIAMTSTTASCTVTVSGLTNTATQTNASCAGNPAAFTNASTSVTTTNATNTSTDQCLVVNTVAPSVAKTFGAASISDSATTTLVFTLTNSGSNPAQSGIAVGDTLPTGLRINSTTPSVAYSTGCSGPAAGAYNTSTRVLSGLTGIAMTSGTSSCTVTVSGLTNASGQTNTSCSGNPAAFTNLSTSVTTTNASNTSTDQCLVVNAATPSLAKTFGAASITDGNTTTLVFTLTNSGSNPAQSGIAVGDTLPTGLRFNSTTPSVGYSAGCSGPASAAYDTTTRVLSGLTGVAMTSGTASCTVTVGGLTNAATQTNASCTGNPAAFTNASASVTTTNATNTSTDQCLVVNAGTPSVAKTFGAASITDNAATTLVFTLTNSGTNPAQSGIAVGDTLPTGLRFNTTTPSVAYSAGCSGPATAAYNTGTRVLSGITGVAMTAGTASCTVTVSGLTNASTQTNTSCSGNPAAFTNAATSVTTTNATNTSTDQCLVVNAAAASVAKTFGAASINDGATTTLVFTLTNSGSNPAQSGIALGDTLPTGLQLNSATPSVSYSAGCSGPANAAYNSATRVLSGLTGIAMTSGTASCTVTVAGLTNAATQTNSSCSGNPAAFTNAAASVTTTNATNASTDQCLVVNTVAPSVAKTFGAATIADNATTTLVFTLTNSGSNPAQSGIAVGDTLPTGLRFNSTTPAVSYSAGCSGPATAAYNTGTRVLSGLTGIAMASATANCTVTVSGVTNATGQTNTSCSGSPAAFTNASTSVTTTNATNTSTDQCLVVTAGAASVAKTFGATSITDNATTTLVFTLTNSGSNPAQSGIAVGDTLPTGLRFNSTTPSVAYSAGCSGPASAAYNTSTRVLSGLTGIAMTSGTASCTVTVAGLTNTATQTNTSCSGNPAAFTNAAASVTTTNATNTSTDQCLVVNAASPSVAKTFGAASITDGNTTTLVFTLTNSGSNPAQSGIALGDTLPTGLRFSSTTPAVAYSSGCSGPATAAYDTTTRVLSGLTGIAMTASTASCTVTVSGLTNAATQTNTSCAGNPATFTNASTSVTTTNATNTSSDQCLVVNAGTPSAAKTFGAAAIADGATTTLVFTLTNSGTNPAQSGIALGDTLPTSLQLNSATPAVTYSSGCSGPANGAYNSGTRVLSGLTGIAMSAGTASCTVTVAGLTNATGQTNTSCSGNPAAFTNAATSVTTTNATNTSTDQCLVVNASPASVAKTFGAASINDNATTTLVFTLTNSGSNPAQSGIALGDTLPTGLRFNSTTPAVAYSAGCSGPANAAYNTGTRVLSGLTGIAMANATASCTVTVSGLTNAATATNASCAGNPAAFTNLATSVTATNATNTSTDQCLVVNTVAPSAAKTFGVASITDGNATTLVFTLTNSGSNPAQSGIALGDTLPTGLRFGSTTPAVAYSAGCSGPATATYNTSTRVLSGITGVAMSSGTASCTVTVSGLTNTATQTNTSCSGSPAAFTNAAASVTTSGATNTSTDQCLVVNASPASVAKTFGAASIGDGGTTTLVFTLTNSGTNPAQSGIALGDTLPSSLQLNSATPAVTYSAGCSGPANAAYNGGTRVLSGLTGIAMAAGTASCTVTVAGLTNATGQTNTSCSGSPAAFTNAATSVTTTNATNTSTDQCLVVTAGTPSAAKTFGAASINDNATTTLVFTLTNSGSNPAQSGIALGDTLPTGLRFTSTTPSVAYSTGCSGPASAAYDTGTRVLSGLAGIAMTSGTASCTLTVSGLTNAATQTNSSCSGNPAAFTNAATSVTTTNATNTSTDQCLVVNAVPPSAAKTFGAASIADNATTTLVFTLTNSGSNPAQSGIALGDTLPSGLRFSSTTPAVTYSSGCSGPANAAYDTGTRILSGITGVAMSAGTASCTVTVSGLTNAATQTNTSCAGSPAAFTNAATSVTTTNATNTSADQCLVVNAGTPTAAKTFGAASINDGSTTTLVFTLTNSGSSPAQSGIALGDTLPSSLQFSSTTPAVTYSTGCSGPANAAYNTGTRVLSGITGVAIGAGTASCTVTVAGLTNVSGQTSSSCTGSPAAFTNLATSVTTTNATNTSTDQCLVVNSIAPSVAKTFGAASIADNATTTLVFTLTNSAGNSAQSGVALGDTLPTGLRFTSTTPAVSYSAGCSGPATAAYNTGTRVLSGLTGIAMANGTASCTVSVGGLTNVATQLNTSCTGNPAAFTNLSSSVTTTNAINTSTDQCLVVSLVAPTAAKTFGAASINDGAATTLVLTLTNQGSNPAQSGIALGDTLPTGLRFGSATPAVTYSTGCSGPATAAYDSGTRVLSGITGVAMASGTTSCTVTVAGLTNVATQANASCSGSPAAFTNTAASVTTTNATNASSDQCLVVNTIAPSVAKTFGAASINDNATTTLVFTLTNSGTNPAQSGIALGDTLPSGLKLNSTTPAVTYSAGCSGPATAAYNTGTRALSGLTGIAMTAGTTSCTVAVAGLTNEATQTSASCSGSPAAFTNLATSVTTTNATNTSTDQCLVVNAGSASVAKTFGGTIIDGGTTTLVFTITNSGSNPAQSGIAIGDTLPTSLRLNSTTPAVTYSTGCSGPANAAYNTTTRVLSGLTGIAVTAGTASCTVTVAGLTNVSGQTNTSCTGNPAAFTNLATSVTTTGATNTSTDQCLLVTVPQANLSVSKTGPATVVTGGSVTYTITVSNAGPDAANGASFSDAVPSLVTGVGGSCGSASGGAACGTVSVSGNTVTSTITTLPSGGSVVFTITGTSSGVGSITNTATIATPSGVNDPTPGNNSSSFGTTIQAPDLTVTKSHGGNFTVGVNGTYTITVSNSGNAATSGTITVTDTLPTGLTFVSATGTGWSCSNASGTVTCTSSTSIAASGSGNAITLVVSVASIASPAVTNFATVSGGNEPGANAANNTGSDYTLVGAAGVTSLSPDNARTTAPGTTVFYPHVFTAGAAGSVTFSTASSSTPSSASWTQAVFRDSDCNGVLNGTEGNAPLTSAVAVNAGDTVCIIVQDNVPASTPFNARNVITVSATLGATTVTRTDVTTVSASGAGLSLTKVVRNVTQSSASGTTGTAKPNDVIEYTITYANNSSGTISSIVITDATPAYTTFESAACGTLPANITACVLTTTPTVGGTGTVTWTLTGSLLSGLSGSVTYQVRIAP